MHRARSYTSRSQQGQALSGVLIGILALFVVLMLVFWLGARVLSWLQPPSLTVKPSPTQTELLSTQDELIVVDNPPTPDPGVTLDDLQEHSAEYVGQQVTVVGVTGRYVEPWGFTIKENADDGQEVLVVPLPNFAQDSDMLPESFKSNVALSITGTVKHLTTEQTEKFGFELNDLQMDPWIGKNVIEASKIEKVE